jgi:hypothetical protein
MGRRGDGILVGRNYISLPRFVCFCDIVVMRFVQEDFVRLISRLVLPGAIWAVVLLSAFVSEEPASAQQEALRVFQNPPLLNTSGKLAAPLSTLSIFVAWNTSAADIARDSTKSQRRLYDRENLESGRRAL